MNELTTSLYQAISKAEQPRVYTNWHASSLAQCPKAQYLMRSGVPAVNKPSGALILRWQTGHHVETTIRPYLLGIFPRLVSNIRFSNDALDLTGEIDNYDPVSKTLIEIKSVHPQAVRYKRKDEDRHHLKDSKPYLHHEIQQHAYVTLMHHPDTRTTYSLEFGQATSEFPIGNAWPVHNIIYVYISLSGLLVLYTTPVKEELLLKVSDTLSTLNTSWAAQTPPQCICVESNPLWGAVLQYCDYRSFNCCESNEA